jgi:hypothetical protein
MEKALSRIFSVVCVVLFAGVVVVNALANALPLFGVGTGQLSDELPNLFVPAGLTFSIWGLIYLLLLGYVFFACGVSFSPKTMAARWDWKDGLAFSINALANIGWIFAWHSRQVGIALILMIVILASLIYLEERVTSWRASITVREGGLAGFFLSVPIRVYLGWILVATIANATAFLVKLGWNGFGIPPWLWTVAVIAAGLCLAFLYLFRHRAYAVALVVAWAFIGIVIKRLGVEAGETQPVWISAGISALALIGVIVFKGITSKPGK